LRQNQKSRTLHEVVDDIIASVSQALRDGKGDYGWILKVDHLPSVKSLERWANSDLVPTPTGYEVEPDGVGPDGVPSWLRILCMI